MQGLEWTRTVVFVSVTRAYLDAVAGMVGNTNDAVFYDRPAGGVVFLGAEHRVKDSGKAVVTFKFSDRDSKASDGLVAVDFGRLRIGV